MPFLISYSSGRGGLRSLFIGPFPINACLYSPFDFACCLSSPLVTESTFHFHLLVQCCPCEFPASPQLLQHHLRSSYQALRDIPG